MAIALLQSATAAVSGGTSFAATFPGACTNGSFIAVVLTQENDSGSWSSISDGTNSYLEKSNGAGGHNQFSGDGLSVVASRQNTSTATLTITATASSSTYGRITILEFSGVATSSELFGEAHSINDSSSVNSDDTLTVNSVPANSLIIRAGTYIATGAATADTSYTTTYLNSGGNLSYHAHEYILDSGASANKTTTFGGTATQQGWSGAMAVFKIAAAGGGGTVNTKSIADTVTLTDSYLDPTYHNRLISDQITIVEEALYKQFIYILSDAVDVLDSIAKACKFFRRVDDQALINEILTGAFIGANTVVYSKTINDTLSLAEALLTYMNRGRVYTDSLTLLQTMAAFMVRGQVVTDSIQISDTNVKRLWLTRQIQEAITLFEALIGLYQPDQIYDVRIVIGVNHAGEPIVGEALDIPMLAAEWRGMPEIGGYA